MFSARWEGLEVRGQGLLLEGVSGPMVAKEWCSQLSPCL